MEYTVDDSSHAKPPIRRRWQEPVKEVGTRKDACVQKTSENNQEWNNWAYQNGGNDKAVDYMAKEDVDEEVKWEAMKAGIHPKEFG
jgi:hypothetical protein